MDHEGKFLFCGRCPREYPVTELAGTADEKCPKCGERLLPRSNRRIEPTAPPLTGPTPEALTELKAIAQERRTGANPANRTTGSEDA